MADEQKESKVARRKKAGANFSGGWQMEQNVPQYTGLSPIWRQWRITCFFYALRKHCKIIESVLMSKCNMNNQVREDARQALGEMKASIYKNFERVKSANFLEACKQSLKEAIASQVTPKRSYANVVAPSGVTENKGKSSDYCVVVDSDNCSSEDVKKIIKPKINPAESKLGEKSPELKASVPKRRNPAIIVKNVPNEVKNEDLLKVITEQNPEIVVDDESIRQCRVRFTLKTFQHTRHVVIETHPTCKSYHVPLNLHKSKSATQQLILNMEADNIDCALVREPHSYRSTLPGYPSTYRLL
ncbi:hypothetical protein TNCV_1367841 [Trichonephila clavipes]|nr:hypothetical protein TNCV_1367841 [Trichonephila clavipes]